MTKTTALLLGTTALAAFGFAGVANAGPALSHKGVIHNVISGGGTLYDQTSSIGSEGIVSQNFESTFVQYDAQGADDFTVPAGTVWKVKEVDAPGLYFNGSGPAASEDVHFYHSHKGKPGKEVGTGRLGLQGVDTAGSFAIKFGRGNAVRLKGGAGGKTYWVSVIANCSFTGGCGEWGWSTSRVLHGNPAQWQNPGGGFGFCPTWGPITTCISGDPDPDFSFALKGAAH